MFAKPRNPKPDPPAEPPAPRYLVPKQADVAAFFAQSVDTVKNWAKAGMPGKPPRYDLQEIVTWLRQKGPWRDARTRQAAAGDDEALVLSGPSTEGLERLRAAKAALAELELQAKRGSLISVEQAKDVGLLWAVVWKRLGERLARRYGSEAAAAVTEALQEAQRVLDTGLAGPPHADPDPELVARSRTAKDRSADKSVGRRRSGRPKRTV